MGHCGCPKFKPKGQCRCPNFKPKGVQDLIDIFTFIQSFKDQTFLCNLRDSFAALYNSSEGEVDLLNWINSAGFNEAEVRVLDGMIHVVSDLFFSHAIYLWQF